ncbi:MAG: restriction endonuclease, partial [Anaerolineales bacterium]
LPLSPDEIKRKLLLMVESDVIKWGTSDIQFRGLQDGTLNLILRHRFEEEIAESQPPPDLRPGFRAQLAQLEADKRRLQGMLNHVTGKFAEHQLANEFRSRKRFALPVFFEGVEDTTPLNMLDVRERVFFQRSDGKRMEIDVLAEARDGRVVLVEVRKRQKKTGVPDVEDFSEKVEIYRQQFPEKTVLPAFLSLGGFTEDARRFCEQEGIGRAERIVWGS